MGTCSCDGESRDGKQVVMDNGSVSIQQTPASGRAQAGADQPASQGAEVNVAFGEPPHSDQKADLMSPYRPGAPVVSRSADAVPLERILALQSFARIYLQKRELSRRDLEALDWSDSEDAQNEDDGETLLDPIALLSDQAKARLQKHAQLRYKEDIKGVHSMKARLLPDRSIYIGQWTSTRNGKIRKGKGRVYCSDGGYKEGYWKNGKLHHFGREISPNGDYYEGGFKSGMRDGKGDLETTDGSTWYSGDWKMGVREGKGTEGYADGTKYEGELRNNKKHGKGKVTYHDGNTYEGDFQDNELHGQGHFHWHDGRDYVGQWNHGKMHGQGRFRYSDGKLYEGMYDNDKKHGYGVYEWEGKKYEGDWHQGKMHGKGWMTTEKGRRQYYFKDGVRGEAVKDS